MTNTNQRDSLDITLSSMPQSRRSLTSQESERVRAKLNELYERMGTQTAVAEATGISQQWIGFVLSGGSAGVGNTRRLADYIGISFEDLVSGKVGQDTRLSAHPDWLEASQAAKEEWPHLAEKIDRLGRIRDIDLETLTPDILADLAHVWEKAKRKSAHRRHHSPPE